MKSNVPAPWLQTLRLELREFVASDQDDIWRLDQDPAVMRYINGGMPTELVRYGFDDLGLHRIVGITHRDNVASQRVLLKAGLRPDGWGRYYGQRLRVFAATNPNP